MVALLATSLWLFQGVHQTVTAAGSTAMPAILEISNAQRALAAADRAAITISPNSSETTTLPAELEYKKQIQIAGLNLAQAAEDNAADDAEETDGLQLAQGLLVVYTDMVEQAGEHYQRGDRALGATYLWYASHLLHEDGGILDVLNGFREQQYAWLKQRFPSTWMMPAATISWAVSLLLVLVLLGATQLFLRRRFRRTLNVLLLAATVLVVGLASMTSLAHVSKNRLDDAHEKVLSVVAARQAETGTEYRAGNTQLAQLLSIECGTNLDRCGLTARQALTASQGDPGAADAPAPFEVAESSKQAIERTTDAAEYSGLAFLIPLLSVIIGALIWSGIHPRINEYRYEPR
ncbi:hypothetical protein [Streptosporangium sp. 'caverna']|uniref:hypothetical protein n=1 Tax=Streptosporangium sp. 'caverna' TaxID=2202249 RepID=UPI000D7E4EC5|nr:hypothetical protein [Streptosporangium sp. 'caverna']AWS41660.1 hypothetical protein DKM19_10155 [Streptosporangium sp. 'caverna']